MSLRVSTACRHLLVSSCVRLIVRLQVAAASGDARRALGVCCAAIEQALEEVHQHKHQHQHKHKQVAQRWKR